MIVVTERAARRRPGRTGARPPRPAAPRGHLNVERLPDLGGAEIALAGYDEPDTLADALEPGDRVFMVSMHEPPERRIALHKGFIDVSVRRGVARIVYLSFVGAGLNATFVHARSHGATEAMLAACGVPFSSVRTGGGTPTRSPPWFDVREGSPARAATAA